MNRTLLTAVTLMVLTTLTLPALALGPLDVDADVTVMSQYVWRGMVANPEAVLQPSMSAGVMGIGFSFWGSMDLTDAKEQNGQFNEVDWIASYGLPLPLVDLDFGLIYYDFPNSEAKSTAEFFVSGSASVLFSPSLAIYYDFKEVDGAYASASISYPIALGEELNMDLGAALGLGDGNYTEGYFGINASGATDLALSASVPFKPIPFFTITPRVTYHTLMSEAKDAVTDAADAVNASDVLYSGDTDAVVYGVSATFSF